MPSLFAFATPLVLLLSFLGHGEDQAHKAGLAGGNSVTVMAAEADSKSARQTPFTAPQYPSSRVPANPLDAFHDGQQVRQIRIEQRVIVRISPRRMQQNELLARLPQQSLNTEYEERKMAKCLPVNRISGVQTGSGNRLMLFTRDNRIISVNLEKACRARDFYSGFYVEKNADGQLCVDRDKLQSRSGAKCEVERMRQLVAVKK